MPGSSLQPPVDQVYNGGFEERMREDYLFSREEGNPIVNVGSHLYPDGVGISQPGEPSSQGNAPGPLGFSPQQRPQQPKHEPQHAPVVAQIGYDDDEELRKLQLSASPLEKLVNNQYLYCLRQMEADLKLIRTRIVQGDIQCLEEDLQHIRYQLTQYANEFKNLKSTHFLRPGDFANLLSLEEFLLSTLLPQLGLYEMDCMHLRNPDSSNGAIAVCLSIVSQENCGPISKEKAIGPFTLRLLTGATITQIQSGPVQPEIVEGTQRIKKNNQELENARQSFRENGTAVFSDLKFSSGTFPSLVRLRFRVTIELVTEGQNVMKTIESETTKPFISMTNTGSQWKDAAGTWLKEECFHAVDTYDVSIARVWNFFQKHYLQCTKQELNHIKRPLFMKDFEYLLRAKFKQGCEKSTMNQKEFQRFWDWVGPGLKKIRYQKHLLLLFEAGYLATFVTREEANEQLKDETIGTFLIRLSERIDGELIISYTHATGVRHYLIQPDDTADKKKTIIDFLGQNSLFVYILQLCTQPSGKRVWYKHNKESVLQKYYKKPPKVANTKSTNAELNPYDVRLPLDPNDFTGR